MGRSSFMLDLLTLCERKLPKDFSLLLEKLGNCQSQHVFISSPIPILEEEIDSFDRLLALKTLLTSACLTHGIHFGIFNIFWNY